MYFQSRQWSHWTNKASVYTGFQTWKWFSTTNSTTNSVVITRNNGLNWRIPRIATQEYLYRQRHFLRTNLRKCLFCVMVKHFKKRRTKYEQSEKSTIEGTPPVRTCEGTYKDYNVHIYLGKEIFTLYFWYKRV